MDRFLKRPALSGSNSSPSSSPLPKKPKVSDKQGNVSGSFRAKEFGSDFYKSVGNCSAEQEIEYICGILPPQDSKENNDLPHNLLNFTA